MGWVCIVIISFSKIYLTDTLADMNQTVYRHLVEQRWRNEGALDLLVRCSNPLCSIVV